MQMSASSLISRRAFLQSIIILAVLMILAGILTRVTPAGRYETTVVGGREVIVPGSYTYIERPNYPIWRWLTAPLEVLWGPDGLTIIVIIVFLLMVGASFMVLDRMGVLKAALGRILSAFRNRKYLLLMVVSLFFMATGAFFGIFEEVVPLVPLVVALSYYLGWDALVGLGMSILATNMGFSAAMTNPFTIGVAQKLIFVAIYIVFAIFIIRYARSVEKDMSRSLVYQEDMANREKYRSVDLEEFISSHPAMGKAMAWLLIFLVLIFALLIGASFIPVLSEFSLPLVGLLFFMGGVGAGVLAGQGWKAVGRSLWEGIIGIAPAIPLILMAASVKLIVVNGAILDTILNRAIALLPESNPFLAAVMIYVLALGLEFFIASGSAKAFLLMPILLPLADLVGVTRQVAVTAYCFGDGFSNLAYPTNPVLLICLGLTVVSYPRWLKWTLKLWVWVALVSLVFLGLGVAIRYGPF